MLPLLYIYISQIGLFYISRCKSWTSPHSRVSVPPQRMQNKLNRDSIQYRLYEYICGLQIGTSSLFTQDLVVLFDFMTVVLFILQELSKPHPKTKPLLLFLADISIFLQISPFSHMLLQVNRLEIDLSRTQVG